MSRRSNSGNSHHRWPNQQRRPLLGAIRCIAMQTVANGNGGPIAWRAIALGSRWTSDSRCSLPAEWTSHVSSVGLDFRSPQSVNNLRHSRRKSPFDSSLYWTPLQRPIGQPTAADTHMANVTQRSNSPGASALMAVNRRTLSVAFVAGAIASLTSTRGMAAATAQRAEVEGTRKFASTSTADGGFDISKVLRGVATVSAACLWVVLAQPAMADHELSSGEPNAPRTRGRPGAEFCAAGARAGGGSGAVSGPAQVAFSERGSLGAFLSGSVT